MAATLELKATKENAHSNLVSSVAFSPDGTKIVSDDKTTIKVWDAVHFRPHVESEWKEFSKGVEKHYEGSGDWETQTWWRNKITGHEQGVKPSGGV